MAPRHLKVVTSMDETTTPEMGTSGILTALVTPTLEDIWDPAQVTVVAARTTTLPILLQTPTREGLLVLGPATAAIQHTTTDTCVLRAALEMLIWPPPPVRLPAANL